MNPNRNVMIRPFAEHTVESTPISEPNADMSSIHLAAPDVSNLSTVASIKAMVIPPSMNTENHLLKVSSFIGIGDSAHGARIS